LSAFDPSRRREWALPEVNDDENVTDWNGSRLAQWTPPTWLVAAYHGASIDDVGRLLETSPVTENIKVLLVHVDINDRLHGRAAPLQTDVNRPRQTTGSTDEEPPRPLHPAAPLFENAPQRRVDDTTRVNTGDLLADTPWLVSLPDDFRSGCARENDFNHYSPDSGEMQIRLISKAIVGLN